MGAGAAAGGLRAALRGASEEELCAALGALPAEARRKLGEALQTAPDSKGQCPRSLCVRILECSAGSGVVELSPFDVMHTGKPIPLIWFYQETLDAVELIAALERTLAEFPVFCGRYASPPTAVELNNAGVPLEVCTVQPEGMTLSEAIARLPAAGPGSPCFFQKADHEPFVPPLALCTGCGSDTPLMAIKITKFPTGGTAIGMLLQHGIGDADAEISFARNWSQAFRGVALDPLPAHDRCIVNRLPAGDDQGEKPEGLKVKVLSDGEQHVPEFAGVLPKISGDSVCVVPLPKSTLQELKKVASAGLPAGEFVSTDDVITACAWQAYCETRCAQLGLPTDSGETTTCMRACNIRKRTDPPLGAGYCGNGVTHVWTESTVRELLAMTPADVARQLRASLQVKTPQNIAACAQWLQKRQTSAKFVYDPHALTFMMSSWGFDWEGVDFNAKPVRFDHGALVPIVTVILPRPDGDGQNVYVSGPRESMEQFARLMTQART